MDGQAPASMSPWLRDARATDETVPATQELTVGEVASLVGISVRTLHHWDAVGLVQPAGRTPGGYRVYSADDVARVHRVLVYQELGFSLTSIAALLDDPAVDESAQLRQQRRLLDERIDRLQRMASAVEQMLASRAAGTTLGAREQAEIFGRGWREDWAVEARQRWGDSDEWAQFEQQAAALSEDDRRRMHEGGQTLYAAMAEAMRAGVPAGSDHADELAEQHRAMIGALFACTHSMHVCIGRLSTSDERFADYFDELEPGLGAWLAAVIDANARHHGVDPEHATWQ